MAKLAVHEMSSVRSGSESANLKFSAHWEKIHPRETTQLTHAWLAASMVKMHL